jgi:hypothetical protein
VSAKTDKFLKMKKIFKLFLFVISFSYAGISQHGQVFMPIFEENFEVKPGGENPYNHCYNLGTFFHDGFFPHWGNYNLKTTYSYIPCYGGIYTGSNGLSPIPFQAIDNSSFGISPSAYNKLAWENNNYVFKDQVGKGIIYMDPDENNPDRLYFGPMQKYGVFFKAIQANPNGDGDNNPLAIGYKEYGNEIVSNTDTDCIGFHYRSGELCDDDIYGACGIVKASEEEWTEYAASVWNRSGFDNAYQFVMAYKECAGEGQYPPLGDPNILIPPPPIHYIDEIRIGCDGFSILVEVKNLVSEIIDYDNCKIKRTYKVGIKYNCIANINNLIYQVRVLDQNNQVISQSIQSGEFFTVEYDFFASPKIKIEVTIPSEHDVGFDFIRWDPGETDLLNYYDDYEEIIPLMENNGNDIVVNNGQNIVWDDNFKIIGSDIIINSGGTLTIKNNVFMAKDKHIWIQKGGTLIVDGGKITSCSEKWYGIVVVGDPTQPQSNTYAHGKVITMNNAKIENAKVGVGNYLWPGISGGIIECSNTEFNNCNYGIWLLPYSQINISFMHNCKFINGIYGVGLVGIKGIEFHTNTFENLERGIWATDSKFEVLYGNIFRNINESGILATATSPGLTSALINDDNQFWNCQYGISLEGNTAIDNHEIAHNYFDNCWFSIDINGDNIYKVLENRFNDCAYGVGSWASGGEVNNVDCNIFQRTEYGNIYMAYINSQSSFMGNDFIESGTGPYKFDFRLYNGKIADNIGAKNQPAMNYFSSPDDIETENSEAFTYWIPNPQVPRTDPQNPGNYLKWDSDNSNSVNCGVPPVPAITDVQIRQYKLNYCYWLIRYRLNPKNAYYKKMFLEARKQFHLAYYYWSIQNEKNLTWQKTDSLLSTMCGDIWKIKRYGLQMYHGDLTQAETILNELDDPREAEPPVISEDLSDESRASFITTQRINLKYQAGKGTYQLSDAELNILRVEGLKNIPERAYASGLYTLVTGNKLPVEWPQEENPIYPRESSDDSEIWSFSPNPANDVMHIAFAGKGAIEGKVTIYNVVGRKMLERPINYNGKSETLLDVSSLIDGMYVITVKDKDENVLKTQKLIICKNK